MIEVVIPEQHYEFYDDVKEEFLPKVDINETKLQIEHSLISLKKWEQTWHKRFLNDYEDKTYEELSDYVRCMTLNHNIDPEVYHWIPKDVMNKVIDYIKDPMTATTIKENNIVTKQKNSREGITAEIIYYWMITLNIPVEFQKWHLNQLLTLIKVVSIKNEKQKPVDKRTSAKERAALNKKRREMYNSKG